MSSMCITVNFLPGTDIKFAVSEAKAKAAIFDVAFVEFKFNGVEFSIGRNADVISVCERYAAGDIKYGIAEA